MNLNGKRILQIHDGGLSPGYTSYAMTLTEEAEACGAQSWAANEGFRSLTGDHHELPRVVHLNLRGREEGATEYITPSVTMYRRIGEAGSEFRSERYPEFKDVAKQKQAAQFVLENNFDAVVAVGGDGTLKGVKGMAKHLPAEMPIGFLNVSTDSDITGDMSMGFLTCAEEGARVARGLFEDGYTHKRIYILEMMGNRSGQHALHSGIAAGAHLIFLPMFDISNDIWQAVADRLSRERHGLIVVAEGFMRQQRKQLPDAPNASTWVKQRLAECGLENSPGRRVIAEPYSRYIRGIQPLFIERKYASLKAHLLMQAFGQDKTRIMPYYQGAADVGVRGFDNLSTYNRVDRAYIHLIDRLHIPALHEYLHRFADDPG